MKKVFLIILILSLTLCSAAQAGNSFFDLCDEALGRVADPASFQSAELSASEYPEKTCILTFNLSEGNQIIIAIVDNRAKVYYQFEEEELLRILYRMIALYPELEAKVPEGYELVYTIRVFEGKGDVELTGEDIRRDYGWLTD